MRIKLKDAFELQIGKTPSRNKSEYWNGVYKWVSISDIGNSRKYVYSTRESITDKGIIDSGIKVIPKGTVIMSFKLSIGKTAITTEDMYTNEAIVAFIDKKKIPIDIDYLYYLCSGSNWMQGVNKAVMGLTLNKATLSEKEINIPNIEIQKKCAGNLDKIDRIIDLKKQQLDQLDLLVRSLFIEMFGDTITNDKYWEYREISSVTEIILGSTPKTSEPKYWDGNIKWITPAEIGEDSFIIFDSIRHITEEGVKSIGIKSFPAGTVIFSTRAPIGKTAIAGCNMYCNQGFKNFICNKKLNPVYLYMLLRINKNFFVELGNGATFKELSKSTLEKIKISVPDINIQNEFELYFNKIDKSKLAVKKSLEELEILKKSLMQKYFA